MGAQRDTEYLLKGYMKGKKEVGVYRCVEFLRYPFCPSTEIEQLCCLPTLGTYGTLQT